MVIRNRTFLIIMLGALDTITPVSIDMYLPAFPKIAGEFQVTVEKVALSVSSYFLGFAIGQIVYGPLLDKYGRKRPLYIGMALYIIASAGCILSGSLQVFLIARFLQALSGCVAAVAAIAMVRDFFTAGESARILSLMILILGASPLLAPTIGSFIVTVFGWHYVFIALASVALILLVIIFFFLPEGHVPDKSISLRPASILRGFGNILLEPQFLIYTLAGSFSFAGLFVYVAGSPGVFMKEFHMNAKVYGGIFAFLSVGFIGGSQLNHYLTRKYLNQIIFKVILIIQVMASIIYLAGVSADWFGIGGNISCLLVILFCAGLSYPNAVAVALSRFTKNTGSAAALLGFIQIGIGGVISSGIGFLNFREDLSVSLVIASSTVIAFLVFLSGKIFFQKTEPENKELISAR